MPHLLFNTQIPATQAWNPRGFNDYPQWYPLTPDIRSRVITDATDEFIAAWDSHTLRRIPDKLSLVMVRGLFGAWIPQHFAVPMRTLAAAGLPVIIAQLPAGGGIAANAELLARDVAARVPGDHRLVFLCHSKGGLDALVLLRRVPAVRERTAALVLCQTPRGGCAYLESALLARHRDADVSTAQRMKEGLLGAAIKLAGARGACLDICGEEISHWMAAIDEGPPLPPALAVASWSVKPTAWLDTQHARLNTIRPGSAHDGLFFLEDLLWPAAEQVLLPLIDHSQPSVGGAGFDHGRFWLALADLALRRC